MARLLDVLSILMLVLAICSLAAGIYVMGNRDDVSAFFLLVVGVVLVRAAVDLLRPRSTG